MSKKSVINYSALWDKIVIYAYKAGRVATRPILLLYYVLISDSTSNADRLIIISALSYLLFPIDIISTKRLPIIGWLDEAISAAAVIKKMRKSITPEIEGKTDATLDKWFPDYAEFEMLPE